MAVYETVLDSSSKSVFELVKALQLKDVHVQQQRAGEAHDKLKGDVEAWIWDS